MEWEQANTCYVISAALLSDLCSMGKWLLLYLRLGMHCVSAMKSWALA